MRVALTTETLRFCRFLPAVAIASLCAACGTFQLSSGAIPLSPKSQDQMQLDNLACKDRARLEASTTERQTGAFLLGMTIVGLPVAYEIEKSKQREVYKSCMEARGYRVLPPKDDVATSETSRPNSPAVPLPSPTVEPPRPAAATPAPSAQVLLVAPQRDEAAQLQKLMELRDKGLISSEEYEKKRKEILDRL